MYAPEEIVEIAIKNGANKTKNTNSKMFVRLYWRCYDFFGIFSLYPSIRPHTIKLFRIRDIVRISNFSYWINRHFTSWRGINHWKHDGCNNCLYDHRISYQKLVGNWVLITITNMIGAIFVAYFFWLLCWTDAY